MDFNIVKTKLLEWMETFVEQSHPSLGNWPPCPYARSARLNNKINILESNIDNLSNEVKQCLSSLELYDVIIICFDHTQISVTDCESLVNRLNVELMPQNYVILEDHPDSIEEISGVVMNFGYCGLLIISELTKLNQASNVLKKKGYYNSWTQENLDDVVSWRFK